MMNNGVGNVGQQNEIVTNNANANIVDNEQIFWTRVYDLFEANYRENMCSEVKTTSKRKIHIDNCEPDLSSVHEPQMKWCPILFLDGIVQIAMNKPFTSKQQACNERRQFNQHGVLQQCIESILGILFMNPGSAAGGAAASTMDGQKNGGISSTSSIDVSTTGQTHNASSSSGKDSNEEEKTIIFDEKPIGNYSKTLYNNPNRRGDSWSYRSWLSCWGSYELLAHCLDSFAGIGKSANKHQLTGLSIIKHLQSIPAVHVDVRVSMEELMRPASFSEIFMYVRMIQTQKDKTDTSGGRGMKKDGTRTTTRRSTKIPEKIPTKVSIQHNNAYTYNGQLYIPSRSSSSGAASAFTSSTVGLHGHMNTTMNHNHHHPHHNYHHNNYHHHNHHYNTNHLGLANLSHAATLSQPLYNYNNNNNNPYPTTSYSPQNSSISRGGMVSPSSSIGGVVVSQNSSIGGVGGGGGGAVVSQSNISVAGGAMVSQSSTGGCGAVVPQNSSIGGGAVLPESSSSSGSGEKETQPPINYENLDETASEGSDHEDEEIPVVVKRSRTINTTEAEGDLGTSLFKSNPGLEDDGVDGGGEEDSNVMGKRKLGSISRRQKPLPLSGLQSLSSLSSSSSSSSLTTGVGSVLGLASLGIGPDLRGQPIGPSTFSPVPVNYTSAPTVGVHSRINMTMNNNHSHNNNNHHLHHNYHHNNYHHHNHHYNNNHLGLANLSHAASLSPASLSQAALSQPSYSYNTNPYLRQASNEGAHLPPPMAMIEGALMNSSYETNPVDLDAVLDFM